MHVWGVVTAFMEAFFGTLFLAQHRQVGKLMKHDAWSPICIIWGIILVVYGQLLLVGGLKRHTSTIVGLFYLRGALVLIGVLLTLAVFLQCPTINENYTISLPLLFYVMSSFSAFLALGGAYKDKGDELPFTKEQTVAGYDYGTNQ